MLACTMREQIAEERKIGEGERRRANETMTEGQEVEDQKEREPVHSHSYIRERQHPGQRVRGDRNMQT